MCDVDLLSDVEKCLIVYAEEYTPPRTDPVAVVHQWVNALALSSDVFAKFHGVKKKKIRKLLKKNELYKDKDSFAKAILNTKHLKHEASACFKFIDLFAGIGGMRQGFEHAGGVCVFSSEYEKNAQQTYLSNFGELPFGDITTISKHDIPAHDVLLAGFPCQPFSHAGLKLGIDDTRGTLFHDIARTLEVKQPKVAVLENVKGLISHAKGHTLKIVLKTLIDMGYKCNINNDLILSGESKQIQKEAREMILRSRDFGVPQNRQRIYIVLWRADLNVDFTYPAPPCLATRVGDILEKSPDPKYTISDKLWEGHKRRRIQNKLDGKGFGYGLVNSESEYTNTISARYYKDGSEALIEQEGKNPRKLTPREAARLQGFPEEFKISSSDVQAYKQFGNSVSVPVIEALANKVKLMLGKG